MSQEDTGSRQGAAHDRAHCGRASQLAMRAAQTPKSFFYLHILLADLRDHLVLPTHFLLQGIDLLPQFPLLRAHLLAVEGRGPVLEELFLPTVEQARGNPRWPRGS